MLAGWPRKPPSPRYRRRCHNVSTRWLPSAARPNLARRKIELTPSFKIDNYAMAVSLVASTRGVALLPASARHFLPWSVVSRPLKGEMPTIDVTVGYHKANTSQVLKTFLSRIDELTAVR